MTIKIVKINSTFNVSKDNGLQTFYMLNLSLSSGVSTTSTLRKFYSTRKLPNLYSRGIPLLCSNFILIHNNKYIGKKFYSTNFWTYESLKLISFNKDIGFDDVIVLTFVKNKNFVGTKGFDNKYRKKYNKVLVNLSSFMVSMHEIKRFLYLPEFLKEFGFFKPDASKYTPLFDTLFRTLVRFGLTESSGMNYEYQLAASLKDPVFYYSTDWETLDHRDSSQITDFISKEISLLDKKYDLLSDRVESIKISVLVCVDPKDSEDSEIINKLPSPKFWILNSIRYYCSLNGIVKDGLGDIMVLELSKSLDDSISKKKLNVEELANILSDAILYNEYEKSITSAAAFPIRGVFFGNGGGLFRAIVPEDRNRDEDKDFSIDFECRISVKLKGTKLNTLNFELFFYESRDWDFMNFNNHTQITDFISKEISLLDKHYNLLSEDVESIVLHAVLPNNPTTPKTTD